MAAAYRHLARSPRSRAEIERKLAAGAYPGPVIRRAVESLVSARYLDDFNFARQWSRDRAGRYGWGPSRLRAELQRKGIETESIEAALRETFSEKSEEDRARELLERQRSRRGLNLADPRERRRWFGYLFRRGYSPEVIRGVFRSFERPGMEDDSAV